MVGKFPKDRVVGLSPSKWPFMAEINGGDPNHLVRRMILQVTTASWFISPLPSLKLTAKAPKKLWFPIGISEILQGRAVSFQGR